MKMNFKKIATLLMITASIMIGGNFAHAQQGPPPTPNSTQIKKMVIELSDTLDLDADQTKDIAELFTDHFKEVKEKFASGRPSRKDMESLDTKFKKEVNSLLNEEQQEQFEAYMKKNKPQQSRPQRR
ncbi:MAG: hypothetical protein JEZ01_13555 [Labilibaculum sp.]|nr:hypothetical protein [Labilibaculum sp.]MBI9058784.1 hypothetical protein [Labilibaculum sp.]